MEASAFPVYGLKGRPMDLRLRSPGWGSHGLDGAINQISLGYVFGDPREPEKAVQIVQGATEQDALYRDSHPGAAHSDLSSIRNLIANYTPTELRKADPFFRDFYRDWNVERLQKTPHQEATIQVGNINVEVKFTSWDESQRVILARLAMENHSLRVASLNTSWEELQAILSTLVVLQEDQEAFDGHQRDRDEMSRRLYEDHDK